MPCGIQICKKPVLSKSSESSLSQWDQVSRTSTVEFLRLAILECIYQLQQCSEDVEATTNLNMDEYSLSTYLLIKRDVYVAMYEFIVDITLRLDVELTKFPQTPWIYSTGNPFSTNHDSFNSTMEKQHTVPFMSASCNSQQEHVISNCVPGGNASFCNDLPNISNLCKFQHTTSTDNVHDTHLLPLSDDTNFTKIVKSSNSDVVDNSIDLIITVPTNNMPTSYCNNANDNMFITNIEIAVSWNTQSLASCHEASISCNTYGNYVIAKTTSACINTSSDNMPTSVTPTKLADDVHRTSNKEEVFNQTHTTISLDKFHAFTETSRAN